MDVETLETIWHCIDGYSTAWLSLLLLAVLLLGWGSGEIVFTARNRLYKCGRDRFIVRASEEKAAELYDEQP